MAKKQNNKYTVQEIDRCINLLKGLLENSSNFIALPENKQIELMKAAGKLSRPDYEQQKQQKKAIRKKNKQKIIKAEKKARAETGIRLARDVDVFKAPRQITDDTNSTEKPKVLHSPRNCYVCKAEYKELHFFYDHT